MRKNRRLLVCMFAILAVVLLFAAELSLRDASGQVRAGRRGAAVKGEEGKGAAVGPRGAVVKGDEGYEAWRAVAGVSAAIAIGTMLARPPSAATTVVVNGTTYWVYQNTYYMRVYSGGNVAYQVVAPPR